MSIESRSGPLKKESQIPEGSHVPSHTRRQKTFLPLDEISPEDLAPGYYDDGGPKDPEQEVITGEEEEKDSFEDFEGDDNWTNWLEHQLQDNKKYEKYKDFKGQKLKDEEAQYWKRIDQLAKEYEATHDETGMKDLSVRFHLPRGVTDREIQRLILKRRRYK